MKRSIFYWEAAGILFIVLLGSLLHSAFEWLGHPIFLAPFLPVNESVWEHLKIALWPALIYAGIEFISFRSSLPNNFIPAKAAGLLLMSSWIIIFYYGYISFTGENILAMDILVFILAVAIGQMTGYLLMRQGPLPDWVTALSAAGIVAAIGVFSLFTFSPLPTALFLDPVNGGYGIPPENLPGFMKPEEPAVRANSSFPE